MKVLDMRENAEKFAVWRMGVNNDWECSYSDVAEATEIPLARVKRICVSNGWRFAEDEEFAPLSFIMRPGSAVDVDQFHV